MPFWDFGASPTIFVWCTLLSRIEKYADRMWADNTFQILFFLLVKFIHDFVHFEEGVNWHIQEEEKYENETCSKSFLHSRIGPFCKKRSMYVMNCIMLFSCNLFQIWCLLFCTYILTSVFCFFYKIHKNYIDTVLHAIFWLLHLSPAQWGFSQFPFCRK